MRKIAIRNASAILLASVFMGSCEKVDEATQFDMSFEAELDVPTNAATSTMDLSMPDIPTDAQNAFAIYNSKPELIEHAELTKLTVELLDPADNDFNWLSSLEVFISNPNSPEQRLAWISAIPQNPGRVLELSTSGQNLMELVRDPQVDMRVELVTDEVIDVQQRIRVKPTFHIDAKVLGQ